MRFRIIGVWSHGGWWESAETFKSREEAEIKMREWRSNQESGDWAVSATMRVVPVNEKEVNP